MRNRSKLLIVGVVALALAAAGGGLAIAGGGDEAEDAAEGPDVAISGDPLDKASAAAIEHLGGGEVTDTEVGDEESYYEVEVSNPDGSQTDVQLDRDFNVVGDETDGAHEDD
jgi:uncharacterized membrane protein YkoI